MAKRADTRKHLLLSALTLTLLGLHWSFPIAASASRSCNYLDFSKGSNINSDLRMYQPGPEGLCSKATLWRAGSGITTDPCQVNHGWLPNGWYDLDSTGMIHDFNGSSIHGRVWSLQDKQCNDGTWRTALFIHTEETVSNGQDCGPNDDDPWCWDDTRADPGAQVGTNDYKSEACIKVRRNSQEGNWNGDMSDTHTTYHDSWGSHGNSITDILNVHS
jgi:hypothetical protein